MYNLIIGNEISLNNCHCPFRDDGCGAITSNEFKLSTCLMYRLNVFFIETVNASMIKGFVFMLFTKLII